MKTKTLARFYLEAVCWILVVDALIGLVFMLTMGRQWTSMQWLAWAVGAVVSALLIPMFTVRDMYDRHLRRVAESNHYLRLVEERNELQARRDQLEKERGK